MARIKLSDLNDPAGKAKRWDGAGFNEPKDKYMSEYIIEFNLPEK